MRQFNENNVFLDMAGRIARSNRVCYWDDNDFSIRISKKDKTIDGGIWFRTEGCCHDRNGGCVICDYSAGPNTEPKQMVSFVENALRQIDEECNSLIVTPSGSMLDENEVPKEARVGIFNLLNKTKHKSFSFETRADTITEASISESIKILNNRLKEVYIGVETANDWMLKYCINKKISTDKIISGFNILNKYQIKSISNVIVGVPFLTEMESVNEAVRTTLWALDNESSTVCLFPIHVKSNTLLAILHELRIYKAPSLWSYLEILMKLNQIVDVSRKVEISWYKTYDAYNVIESPLTCEKCYQRVINNLDLFSEKKEIKYIEELLELRCDCKEVWNEKMSKINDYSMPERVLSGYFEISKRLGLDEWWIKFGKEIEKNTYEEYDNLI